MLLLFAIGVLRLWIMPHVLPCLPSAILPYVIATRGQSYHSYKSPFTPPSTISKQTALKGSAATLTKEKEPTQQNKTTKVKPKQFLQNRAMHNSLAWTLQRFATPGHSSMGLMPSLGARIPCSMFWGTGRWFQLGFKCELSWCFEAVVARCMQDHQSPCCFPAEHPHLYPPSAGRVLCMLPLDLLAWNGWWGCTECTPCPKYISIAHGEVMGGLSVMVVNQSCIGSVQLHAACVAGHSSTNSQVLTPVPSCPPASREKWWQHPPSSLRQELQDGKSQWSEAG